MSLILSPDFKKFYINSLFWKNASSIIVFYVIFLICTNIALWNGQLQLQCLPAYLFYKFHEGIYKKLVLKVINTYLQSLMNSVWYVSVPYLIPLSKPRGVSVSTTSSNSNTLRSLTVIQRNMALKHNHNYFSCICAWADFWERIDILNRKHWIKQRLLKIFPSQLSPYIWQIVLP